MTADLRRRLRTAIALLAVVGAPLAAQGRPGSIHGVITNVRVKRPIEGARISLLGTPYAVTSDRTGAFDFTGIAAGRYTIQAAAIGFGAMNSAIVVVEGETLELEFQADPEAVKLPELTVEEQANNGPADWLRRKVDGRGRYITRKHLEERQVATLPDALRLVPGVRIECRGNQICTARMARSPQGCFPGYFMDGIPTDQAVLWMTPVQEIEGIEVYSGPAETPPELEGIHARCGVIALWTRPPPPRRPKEKKPKPGKDPAPADTIKPPAARGF